MRGFVASYNRVGSFPIIGRQGALCGNVNMAKGKFFATEHAVVVENYCDTDVIWAYYALTALNLNQYATATAQPGLSVAVLNDVHIQIPPPKEQARISKAIEYLFALIVQVEQSKENLQTAIKQAKNKILELAISGKLVPQDPTDEPASELLKRINPKAHITCDNEHNRKLPNTWCCPTINEVFTINPKNKVLDNINAGFVPMAYIDDGYRGTFKYEKRKWADIKIGFTHFADNDIAIAKISPCLENRKSMILKNLPNGIGAGTTELYVFRPLCVNPKYALYFFKSNLFIQHCVGTFNGVVGQQRVAKNIIKEIIFPFPPLPEQQRIVSKIEELFALFEKIEVD